MKRSEFIKQGFKCIAGLGLAIPATNIKLSKVVIENAVNCTETARETAGPFPTKNPASLEMIDIRDDRVGVPMDVKISIANIDNGCSLVEDIIVDIWHCDKDGYYSEYGGSGIQREDFTNVSFLRGRQVTDRQGMVGFKSIFPGWYRGRATHIHVHIYNANGDSLLVTQIAFPRNICDTVYTTATNFYTSGTQDTANERDNVFGDGYADQLAVITGNVNDGYLLTHEINVSAGEGVGISCDANAGTIQF